ncbi:hypothetical protein EV700_0866 [Fluviicoccus keumensis]|uniref:Pirin n=1 Tax=Fluviicoccus keumensis TaxID=1435465 RepID=A0A4Q7ZDC4_9GAMM|nr:pirin family protein [Fluviicoccus keumensis]RZU47899.1 hypothetical protein EV700_0866 [Fluviicoccus keumensis]
MMDSVNSGEAVRIAARVADVGGMPLRRVLPSRHKRLIGAWCFLDHAGPADVRDSGGMRVGPHPHIGLQTFTWMIEGELIHRDSLGYVQRIRPGQVNLMTAGRGIAHSEESPADRPPRLQAAQLWIALPEAQRHGEPAFEHYPELPGLLRDGFQVTLLVGEWLGLTSPVRVHSPLLGADLTATGAAATTLPLCPDFEYGVMVLEGGATAAGEALQPGELLALPIGRDSLAMHSDGPVRLLLIGGAPLGEEILVWWNFVARRAEEVAEATAQWNAGTHFGEVAGFDGPRLVAPPLPSNLKPAG